MKATLIVLVLAILAVAVCAQAPAASPTRQPREVPAIMTPAPTNFKKPIIFAPVAPASTVDGDVPLTGTPPANLKKANISENIYGGVVEFARGRNYNGCPCRLNVPEKFRYDAQFRKPFNLTQWRLRNNGTRCGCPPKIKKPEDALPPVVAVLRKRHRQRNTTLVPCRRNVTAPVPVKIAPEYYNRRLSRKERAAKKAAWLAKQGCAKNATLPTTVQPKFYPSRQERRARRKARRAAKAAAAKKF
jgi:hypothetical protein